MGHDHLLALFVAADNPSQYAQETDINLNRVEDQRFYKLTDGERKVADVEVAKVGGGVAGRIVFGNYTGILCGGEKAD